MGKEFKYIDRPDAIIDRSNGEEIKIYEESDEIPAAYYALISNNVAYFASMTNHFDWAVDMLFEDGNDDSCIGLIENGICTKTWNRDEVLNPNVEEFAFCTPLDSKFEIGKKYRIDDSRDIIEVVKRSKCYVTVSGAFNGKYKVHVTHHEIGNEEVLLIYSGKYRENLSLCSSLDSIDRFLS